MKKKKNHTIKNKTKYIDQVTKRKRNHFKVKVATPGCIKLTEEWFSF